MLAKTKMDNQNTNNAAPNTVFTPNQPPVEGSVPSAPANPQATPGPAEQPIIPSENSLENTPTQTVEPTNTTNTTQTAPATSAPTPPKPRFHFNKVFFIIVGLAVLILIAVLVTARIISQRQSAQLQSPSASVNEQGVTLGAATDDSRAALQLQGSDNRLIVNGDVIITGRLGVASGNFFGQIIANGLTANREYNLPDSGGTLCLDSNNCNFLQDGTTSSPTFGTITVVGAVTQNGNTVCDSSNNCSFAGSDDAFIQGGNSFGATAVLGTNDARSLVFETGGNAQVTIANGGAVNFQNSTNSTNAFSITNAAGTDTVLRVDTINNYLRSAGRVDAGNINTSGFDQCNTIFGLLNCNTTFNSESTFTNTTSSSFGIYNVLGATATTIANTSAVSGISNLAFNAGSQDFTYVTGITNTAAATTTGSTSSVVGIANLVNVSNGTGLTGAQIGLDNDLVAGNGAFFLHGEDTTITTTASKNYGQVFGNTISLNNSGNITTSAGVRIALDNDATGAIDTYYGILLETPTAEDGSSIDNLYGVYIGNQSGISSGNSYNIYSAGTGSQNYFEGHSAFGQDASVSDGTVAHFADTYTATTGNLYGVHSEITLDPSATSTAANVAVLGSVTTEGTNANDINSNAFGIQGIVTHNGSGSLGSTISGVIGQAILGGGGDVTFLNGVTAHAVDYGSGSIYQAAGIYSRVIHAGSGLIGTSAGIVIDGAENSEGGTITQNYGILIQGQNAGTENYGLAVGVAGTQTLWVGSNVNNTTANAGIAFGQSRDTNLYRSAVGTLTTDDDLIVSSQLAVGSSGAIASGVVALFSEEFTDTSGAVMATYHGITLNPAGASNTSASGVVAIVETDAANANNYTGYTTAVNGQVVHNGNGTMDFGFGTGGLVTNSGAGNIAIAYGLTGAVSNSSGGNISFLAAGVTGQVANSGVGGVATASALFAATATNPGGGTITDNYGLYVQGQDAGTNDYGIRVDTAETQTLWLAGDGGTANTGIAFGSARDTNLYRGTANQLKTDDNFMIDNANLGVGGTPGAYRLFVNDNNGSTYIASFSNDGNNASYGGIRIQAGADDASGTTYYLDAYDGDGTQVGYLANTSGTFAVTDISDARTKTNIQDTVVDAEQVLNGLRVVDFNRIQNPDGALITGFIAQEVQEVYAQAVTQGANGLLGISKDAFIPVLVKGHQNQQSELEVINSKIAAIEQQLNGINGGQALPGDDNFSSINVSGPTTLQQLTVVGSASIAELTVTGNARIAGNITIGGHVLGNADTRGSLTVPAGEASFRYLFERPYTTGSQPVVILTPKNTFAPDYRVESDQAGFTVYFQNSVTSEVVMNYQVQE